MSYTSEKSPVVVYNNDIKGRTSLYVPLSLISQHKSECDDTVSSGEDLLCFVRLHL